MTPELLVAIATILVTLGIACVGWCFVSQANATADEALRVAKAADARADRLERIATEKRDVAWSQVPPARNTALCRIQNIGSDTAHNVQLLVDVIDDPSDRRQTEIVARIQPKETIELDLIDLLRKANPQGLENTQYARGSFTVRVRVTWRSESGVESLKEFPRLTFSG